MLEQKNIPEKIEKTEKKIKELEFSNQKLDSDIKEFLEELNVTPDQLTTFCTDSSNFNEKNWKELKNTQEDLEATLETAINSAHNPLETKKKLSEQIIANRWIYVK